MKKMLNKGQSYTDFNVIIVLITVFSILTFTIIGHNDSTISSKPSDEIKKFITIKLNLQNVIPYKSKKFVIQCNKDVCITQLGVITLSDISESFNILVQTT